MTTALTTTAAEAANVTKTAEAQRLLARFASDIEREGLVDTLSVLPTTGERALISWRMQGLVGSLRPANYSVSGKDRAGAAVGRMFAKGWPTFKSDDVRKVAAGYVENLGDYPPWAIDAVCDALSIGAVEGVSPDFPPSGARIAQLCKEKIADMVAEKAKCSRVLSIKTVRSGRPVMTEAECAAATARHEAWKQKHQPVTESAEEIERRRKSTEESRRANEESILRDYAARGMEPVRTSTGTLVVSPSLLKFIQEDRKLTAQHVEERRKEDGR